MPGDRLWAVLHEAAKDTGPDWIACQNFTRVAKTPALAAIGARLSEDMTQVTLTHPNRPELSINPDSEDQDPTGLYLPGH